MKIYREWAMPNKITFGVKPIKELIRQLFRELKDNSLVVDPFVYKSPFKKRCVSNDINPEIEADYNIDALDFLKMFEDNSVDLCFFDPPYSPRQVSESYKNVGGVVNMETTQAKFWSDIKFEISRILKVGGKCVTCCCLLVPHGGWHYDTIVVVEHKAYSQTQLFDTLGISC